ncbi:MAG: lytic transglycosylase domain-containing protein, partial [Candidatus Eisenbacteria bacterium]|nr:lytic transglycosylase domain-containing protein [Candidatus Eisenbacteria bacterium]
CIRDRTPAGPCDRLDREAARRAARLRLLRRFGRADWTSPDQERLESALPVGGRAEAFLCLGLPEVGVGGAGGRGAAAPVSLRYPRPFPSWIEQRCREVSVSPDLVWAIARRESLFDPGAVSGAGARGLLQMMAPTAQETASKWGIEAGPLERADRNLALGIRHFRDLADGQDWPLPALLAAYNAGSAKASEWVERFGDDPDLLIERIGWRETREYVRHVLDAVWTYRNAYGRSGGEQGGGTAEPQG